jgi:hypothetical protein
VSGSLADGSLRLEADVPWRFMSVEEEMPFSRAIVEHNELLNLARKEDNTALVESLQKRKSFQIDDRLGSIYLPRLCRSRHYGLLALVGRHGRKSDVFYQVVLPGAVRGSGDE